MRPRRCGHSRNQRGPDAFFAYERLLRRGRVLRGSAVSVYEAGVELASGECVAFDVLALATGSSYAYPAKDGCAISADIWFRAFGVRPNTDYLADGSLVTLAEGARSP